MSICYWKTKKRINKFQACDWTVVKNPVLMSSDGLIFAQPPERLELQILPSILGKREKI